MPIMPRSRAISGLLAIGKTVYLTGNQFPKMHNLFWSRGPVVCESESHMKGGIRRFEAPSACSAGSAGAKTVERVRGTSGSDPGDLVEGRAEPARFEAFYDFPFSSCPSPAAWRAGMREKPKGSKSGCG